MQSAVDQTFGTGWDDPALPKRGWTCVGVDDLGADGPDYVPGVCEMCGQDTFKIQ